MIRLIIILDELKTKTPKMVSTSDRFQLRVVSSVQLEDVESIKKYMLDGTLRDIENKSYIFGAVSYNDETDAKRN